MFLECLRFAWNVWAQVVLFCFILFQSFGVGPPYAISLSSPVNTPSLKRQTMTTVTTGEITNNDPESVPDKTFCNRNRRPGMRSGNLKMEKINQPSIASRLHCQRVVVSICDLSVQVLVLEVILRHF